MLVGFAGAGLLVIIIAGYFLIGSVYSSPSGALSECKVIEQNSEGGVNLVFFADKEISKKYFDALMGFEPFGSYRKNFNTYYIDGYGAECEIYKGVALLCYSRELIRRAGSCPNDIIVVVKDMESSVRSSAYMNVVSLNSRLPLSVFAHEFGHAFANLADEYVPAKLTRKSKNCAKLCSDFGESKDGCFEGCSETSYFRSIEDGVMRTLRSSKFGVFNDKLILDNIKVKGSVTGSAIQEIRDCSKEKYYLVEGVYSRDNVSINTQRIEVGCVGGNGAGAFDYQFIKEDGSVVSGKNFNPELIFTDMADENNLLSGGGVESDKPFILKVPVVEGVKELGIKREGELLTKFALHDEREGARPCRES